MVAVDCKFHEAKNTQVDYSLHAVTKQNGPCLTPDMVTFKFLVITNFMENLNQVSSISLLMTSSTALASEGLFEPTRRPS